MRGVQARTLHTGLLAGTLVLAGSALAQAERPAGEATGRHDAATALPEVIVTAQKRSERLQDVPLAVSAVTSDTLLESNQARVQDYFTKVPGLNIQAQGNGQASLAIRGVTTGSGTNPVVGIVIDDVPYGPSVATAYGSVLIPDLDPSALAQIEVLRGPQGTLYGAASLGGLIKFVTAEPATEGISGRVEVSGNQVAHGGVGAGLRAGVNLPVGSTMAILASGFTRRDPGYIDNVNAHDDDVDDIDVRGGRLAALWRPTDAVALKLAALMQNFSGDGTADIDADASLRPTSGSLAQLRIPGTGGYDIRTRLYSATLDVDFGGVDLKSITGYGVNKYGELIDLSAGFGFLSTRGGATIDNAFETKRLTQELRLSSSGTNAFDWVIGAFYNQERSRGAQSVLTRDFATGAIAPDVFVGDPAGNLISIRNRPRLREVAGFADITARLSDRFDVQVGARYSESRQSYLQSGTGLLAGPGASVRSSDDATTYLLTPRLRISPDLMVYARVASGYRVGGPNSAAAFNPAVPAQFDPDRATNYEIGVKGSAFGRMMSFDVAGYYIDWKDIQLSFTDPVGGFTFFANGAKAKSSGVEASVTAAPVDGLNISGNATYGEATLAQELRAGFGYGLDGERLPFSSEFAASLSSDYDFAVSSTVNAFLGASITYVGERLGGLRGSSNDLRLRFPSYTTGDLRAGFRTDAWRFSVFINNVADERGVASAASRGLTSGPTDVFGVTYIRPRTIGASISRDF